MAPAPHTVQNALAAAALARAYGIGAGAVRAGLRGFRPDAHRIAHVIDVGGVSYVDDSKATNPHAAAASLRAYGSVVWIAGGLAKGASFDELVLAARPRLRGVVLIGRDRGLIRQALARHAPDVPVREVTGHETGRMPSTATGPSVTQGDQVPPDPAALMTGAVAAAAALAHPGDTVLLAPACASMDQFRDYAARGDAFAAAARRVAHGRV